MMSLTKSKHTYHLLHPFISISPFFTHTLNQNPNELDILNQLSNLLPIRHQSSPVVSNPKSELNAKSAALTVPSADTDVKCDRSDRLISAELDGRRVKCALSVVSAEIDDKCDFNDLDVDSDNVDNKAFTNPRLDRLLTGKSAVRRALNAASDDIDAGYDRLVSCDDRLRGVLVNGKSAFKGALAAASVNIDDKCDFTELGYGSYNVGFKAFPDPRLDRLLTPEDKLRGVFVQKLKGKTAVKRVLTAVSADIDVESDFSDLVSKVLNRGSLDGESMVTVFEWAIESGKMCEDVQSYNLVFKALGRRKFFDVMVRLLGEMRGKGVKGNYETLFVFVDSYVKAKRVSKGLDIYKKLDEFGMECDLECLKVMLRCLCQRAHVVGASSLMNKMKGKVRFDGETYNIVIRGWCKFGRVNEIERLLNEMVEDGLDPDSLTLSYLLEGLGRGGRIDDAVKIFENLKEQKDYLLNAIIFNAMIYNFISIGDTDECLKYYNDMLSNNYEPNMDIYVSMIFALLKARRVSDAIEMFDEMIGRGIMPTTGVITSVIESLCSYGPPHAAMMIYKKAKDAKCTISVTAYKILLTRLSRFGKCGMLLHVWDEMEQSGYVSDVEVYEYIINGLCNNGQLEKGVLVMEECLKQGFCPSRLICAKLNNKLLASNKVEMAYKLFLKIKKSRRDENAQKYWRAKGWHF